jgi:hypothetical protein
MQDRAMSSGDTKFRQLLVELKPPITATSTWVQVKRAVSTPCRASFGSSAGTRSKPKPAA